MIILETLRKFTPCHFKDKIELSNFKSRGDKDTKNFFWDILLKEALVIFGDRTIVTFAASPHTDRFIQFSRSLANRFDKSPTHLIVWNKPDEITTPGIASVSDEDFSQIAQAITEAVNFFKFLGIKENLQIYSLSGYSRDEDFNKGKGLSIGVQSNELPHIHVVASPKKENSQKKKLSPQELFKFYSPLPEVFSEVFRSLVNSLVSGKGLQIENFSYENNPYQPGLKIFQDGYSLEDYLRLMKELGLSFNRIYQTLMEKMFWLYVFPDKKQELIEGKNGLKASLKEEGLDDELIDQLITFASNFRPTLAQIQLELRSNKLSQDERERLEKLEEKYLRQKESLNNSKRLLKVFKRLGIAGRKQRLLMMKFFQDNLISLEELEKEKKPRFTLSGNFSWKFIIDYDIDEQSSSIKVKNVLIFPFLFSGLGGNTMEIIGDVFLSR